MNFMAGLRERVAVKKWKCGFRWIVRSHAHLIIIFSFAPAAPLVEGAAAAASGSTARRFRNDRRIMRSDLPEIDCIRQSISDNSQRPRVWRAGLVCS
jgi:hypothetical protein